jgi:ABC-type sugar transport system substrate-binding protein
MLNPIGGGSHVRQSIVFLTALAAAALFAACGGDDSDTNGPSGPSGTGLELGEVIESTPAGATVEPWYLWNNESCEFEETDDHPAEYTAELRSVNGADPQVAQAGYMHYGNKDPFGTAVSESIEGSAEEAGMPLNVYNLRFPSKTEPQVQARASVTKQDNAVIQANIDTSVLPGFFDILQEQGCIPSIQLFIPIAEEHGNPAFGNNWPDVGNIIGTYIAKEATKRGWKPEDTAIVQCTDPAHGPSVNVMHDELDKAADAEGFKPPDQNRFRITCKEEEADSGFQAATDWFSGHPDFKHVAMAAIDAVRAVPMSRAIQQSQDRPDEDTIVAGGADDITSRDALRRGEYDLSVDFLGHRFGDWVVPMLQDIMAGNAVPAFVGTDLIELTRENVDEHYPDD